MTRVNENRPDPLQLLRRISGDARRRAALRVYLGYAVGCGATTSMLDEARRRTGRGTDLVVAAYRVHDEPREALSGLDVLGGGRDVPASRALDVAAVMARNPEVVVIDDLVERDSRGRLRFDAVPKFLAAGMTVLATLHVLSVRSVAEAMAEMLGDRGHQDPILDDAVLDLIDELEIVDLPPEDLLKRVRERAILTPAQLATGMQHELRLSVLRVLRESALRMIAEHADKRLTGYLGESDGQSAWEFRGRIVLCLSVRPGLEERIRKTAQYSASQGAKFTVATVRTKQLSDEQKRWLGGYAALTHQLGGEFVRLEGRTVASTLAEYIRRSLATEVILGHRMRPRWLPWDTTSELIRVLSGVDIHILREDRPARWSSDARRGSVLAAR